VAGGWEVADGVDAAVDPQKPADPEAVFDDIDGQPRIEELRAGDDAVLARGEVGDGFVEIPVTIPGKWTHP
jgi:hypothetical protein